MEKSDRRVFVVLGDGELDEGSVWEALMGAAKYGLDRLTAIVDYNKIQSYGAVDAVQPLEPLADKFRAFGFAAVEVDGHDVAALRDVLGRVPLQGGRPNAIICHTVQGARHSGCRAQSGLAPPGAAQRCRTGRDSRCAGGRIACAASA